MACGDTTMQMIAVGNVVTSPYSCINMWFLLAGKFFLYNVSYIKDHIVIGVRNQFSFISRFIIQTLPLLSVNSVINSCILRRGTSGVVIFSHQMRSIGFSHLYVLLHSVIASFIVLFAYIALAIESIFTLFVWS